MLIGSHNSKRTYNVVRGWQLISKNNFFESNIDIIKHIQIGIRIFCLLYYVVISFIANQEILRVKFVYRIDNIIIIRLAKPINCKTVACQFHYARFL